MTTKEYPALPQTAEYEIVDEDLFDIDVDLSEWVAGQVIVKEA